MHEKTRYIRAEFAGEAVESARMPSRRARPRIWKALLPLLRSTCFIRFATEDAASGIGGIEEDEARCHSH